MPRSPTTLAKLKTYRAKRDFDASPEPAGRGSAPRSKMAKPRRAGAAPLSFVVQKHDASVLHYDFRLEHDGVLLSWSVPKGPSMSPGVRRLAVRVEDHPLDYADFEGVIPKGHYGAGTVVCWDRGRFVPDGDVDASLAAGRLSFELEGEKLRGRFHLVRTNRPGEKREHWLLFKGKDAASVEDVPALLRRLPLPFELTNLDKVLYPESGLRKSDLVAYYAAIASHALPYLVGRPLMLVRCPSGRGGKCFFQKHANRGVPAAVRRIRDVPDDGSPAVEHMVVEDRAGLVALAQLGVLEVHTWSCRADALERPDQLVFDLDPDPSLEWDAVVEAALLVRERLAALDLVSFVKTTGGKGLHVVAPVTRRHDWATHRAFAAGFVDRLARERPARYVTNARLARRRSRIFLDYLRNGRGATAVAPYSTRARPGATVATPIGWDELERGIDPRAFDLRTVLARLDAGSPDPWRAYASTKQALRARALREVGAGKSP